jgi:hypothetical protein
MSLWSAATPASRAIRQASRPMPTARHRIPRAHDCPEPDMPDGVRVSDAITSQAGQAIRASDGERDQVVSLLQRDFADGRLTQAELEERVAAALAARTRDQLRALTADLPAADARPARPAIVLDPRLLCLLLFLCPPAGVAYWLLSRRGISVRWLSQRQLAGIPNWAWILIITAAAAAAHR